MKILICTDSMGLGGAETHILSLTKQLCNLGHTVVLASPRGRLTEQADTRIKFCPLPQCSHNPHKILKQYRILKRLVRKEKFDIMHAHARMQALLLGIIGRKYKVPLTVSAHAMFNMKNLRSGLSEWGDKTIAVSQDIKQLLIEKCKVYPENITVITNGIDTEHFSPSADTENIEAAKTVRNTADADKKKEIIFVSRLDTDCSEGARVLCRIAGRLNGKYEGITITIIGDGKSYGEISSLADIMNTACGREVIHMVGGCADVAPYLRKADIFVGVSRAAMEAGACGLPLIIAGNEGYGGILEPGTSEEATNLCARGREKINADTLYKDLCILLDMTAAERQQRGIKIRGYIIKNYSADLSAQMTVKVYREAIQKCANIRGKQKSDVRAVIISDTENDVSSVCGTLALTEKLNATGSVSQVLICHKPGRGQQIYGIKCISENNAIKIGKALHDSEFLIISSVRISYTWIKKNLKTIKKAVKKGKKIILFNVTVANFYNAKSRKKVRILLLCADFISFADNISVGMAYSLGIRAGGRIVGCYTDCAVLCAKTDNARSDFLLSEIVGREGKSLIAFSLDTDRKIFMSRKKEIRHLHRLAVSVDGICDICHAEPIFISLSPYSYRITDTLRKRLKHRGYTVRGMTPQETVGIISKCAATVGMSRAFLLLSYDANKKAVCISTDSGVLSLAEQFGLPCPLPYFIPSAEKLISSVVKAAKGRNTEKYPSDTEKKQAGMQLSNLVSFIEQNKNSIKSYKKRNAQAHGKIRHV